MHKCKLSDCVKEINNRTTENNQYEVLTSSKNGIFSQEEYFDKQVASKDNTGYKIIEKGQFTYRSMSDSGTFTINRLEDKDIGIVSPAYPVFEATNIDAEFLKYYFKSELFNKAIINLSQGSTRTALKFKDLIDIEIFLPEIEEQKKIVKILKNNDQIIEKYDKLIKEKEQFIKSQFVEMFGGIGHYEKIGDICSIKARIGWQGLTKKEYLESGDYYLVTGTDFNGNTIDFNNCSFVTQERYNQDENIQLKEKDVLVTKDGTIGKVAFIDKLPKPATLNSGVFVVRDKLNILNPIYLEYALLSNDFSRFIRKIKTGSTIAHLNQEVFLKFRIPIPEKKLQDKFEPIVQLIDKQKFELEKQKQNYIHLKKGLMQQLLTGKLKVS